MTLVGFLTIEGIVDLWVNFTQILQYYQNNKNPVQNITQCPTSMYLYSIPCETPMANQRSYKKL